MVRFIVCSIFVLGLFSANAPADEKFTSEKGQYSATFPKAPTESEKEIDTPTGKLTLHVATVEVKRDLGMIVIYVDYPEAVKQQKPHEVLARVRDGSKGPNGIVVEEKEIRLNGKIPGIEYALKKDDIVLYRARIYLDGARLYQTIVTGIKKDDVFSPSADKFLDSFELSK